MHDVRSEPSEQGWVAWCRECKVTMTELSRTDALDIRRRHLAGQPMMRPPKTDGAR